MIVVDRTGKQHRIAGRIGDSVMEILVDSDLDDSIGVCGGCCSCGTCHVIVTPEFLSILPPMADDERDLLSTLDGREPTSRLSCQIPYTASLAELTITLPRDL